MTEREREPKDIDTGDRMATLAAATADAMKHKVRGEHETEDGARYTFEVPQGGTEDPDEPMIGGAMARQTVGRQRTC